MTLSHIGGRGLLLQRFAQLTEQARVLDCDYRLGSKILYQIDLFVREWTDLLAVDIDHAKQCFISAQSNGQ